MECGSCSVVATPGSPLCDEVSSLQPLAVDTAPSPPPSGLAPNSKALFGKEVLDLLVDLETARPGYGKDIVCVLAGIASDDVFMKVEKSLRKMARKKLRIPRTAWA